MKTRGEAEEPSCLPCNRFAPTMNNKRVKLPKLDLSPVTMSDAGPSFARSSLEPGLEPSAQSLSDSSSDSPLKTPQTEEYEYSGYVQDGSFLRRESAQSINLANMWSLGYESDQAKSQRRSDSHTQQHVPDSHDTFTPTNETAPEEYNFTRNQIKKMIREIHGVKDPSLDVPAPLLGDKDTINVLAQLPSWKLKSLNQMKIIQWYCCQCGKSYGDLNHFVIKEDHLEKNDLYWDASVDQLLGQTINRFDCVRCSHMMCPYCIKARLSDLLNR
ncbi:hypothetical protein OGAPHI_000691 [Ogataea philodendri]|uniref:Uncharacterized protein n=1 Tax=Ogataea philodendri TaxID=1378263 RepID=A0A9P8PG31_9ASCO|nr:uncharacterized protein OGAPHI_000691 [Ogataea philodendri]KAH3670980.1 hypothetical protein OGAPHI_000691 [Ogataea philodendri]